MKRYCPSCGCESFSAPIALSGTATVSFVPDADPIDDWETDDDQGDNLVVSPTAQLQCDDCDWEGLRSALADVPPETEDDDEDEDEDAEEEE